MILDQGDKWITSSIKYSFEKKKGLVCLTEKE